MRSLRWEKWGWVVRSRSFPSLTKFWISEMKMNKRETLSMIRHLDNLMTLQGTLKTYEQHTFPMQQICDDSYQVWYKRYTFQLKWQHMCDSAWKFGHECETCLHDNKNSLLQIFPFETSQNSTLREKQQFPMPKDNTYNMTRKVQTKLAIYEWQWKHKILGWK